MNRDIFSDFMIGIDIENEVRKLLRESFHAFKAEGVWELSDNGDVIWVAKGGEGFWGDRLPIEISIKPNDLMPALENFIGDWDDWKHLDDPTNAKMLMSLRNWQEAVAKAIAAVEAMSAT